MSPRFTLKDFSVTRRTLTIGPLNVDLHAGDRLGILGVSGSGKSTVIESLAGFVTKTRGTFEIDDHDASRWPLHRRGIAAAFQDDGLWDEITARDNVSVAGVTADHADALLAELGLLASSSVKAATLSGGERRRVAIARALAARPRLLLLDEPGSHLDPQSRLHVASVVARHLEASGAVLVVTGHSLGDVLPFGVDQLLLLEDGVVRGAGPLDHMLNHPETENAARILGYGTLLTATASDQGVLCALGLLPNIPSLGENSTGREGTLAFRDDAIRIAPDGLARGKVLRRVPTSRGERLLIELQGGERVLVWGEETMSENVQLAWETPVWIEKRSASR